MQEEVTRPDYFPGPPRIKYSGLHEGDVVQVIGTELVGRLWGWASERVAYVELVHKGKLEVWLVDVGDLEKRADGRKPR